MEIDLPTRYGKLQARFNVPPGALRLPEFVFNLFPLEERLVGMGVRAEQREGRSVSCRAGCGACCRQPVPISMPEAFLLYEFLSGQPKERRETVIARFESAREVLQTHGFGERSLSAEAQEGEVVDLALDYFKLQLPCPFLEAESCSIHPFRPMSCREHLVTNDPELCAIPDHPGIRGIIAPASLTQALALLYAALEQKPPLVMPLPLALEYAADQKAAREKRYEAEALFASFLAILDPLLRPDNP